MIIWNLVSVYFVYKKYNVLTFLVLDIIKNNNKVTLPDAIIVGAAKAGTTSLFNYLTEHPNMFHQERKSHGFLVLKIILNLLSYHTLAKKSTRNYF